MKKYCIPLLAFCLGSWKGDDFLEVFFPPEPVLSQRPVTDEALVAQKVKWVCFEHIKKSKIPDIYKGKSLTLTVDGDYSGTYTMNISVEGVSGVIGVIELSDDLEVVSGDIDWN